MIFPRPGLASVVLAVTLTAASAQDPAAACSELDDAIEKVVVRSPPKPRYVLGEGWTFKSASGCFSMTIGGRIQVRSTFTDKEPENGGSESSKVDLGVQRARLWFKGVAFAPTLRYEQQLDISGPLSATEKGSISEHDIVSVKYAYVEWQVLKDNPLFDVTAGQFIVPYSRQQITSSAKQEFVDRSPINKTFAPSLAWGLMLSGRTGGEKHDWFEYDVGAFSVPEGTFGGPNSLPIPEGVNVNTLTLDPRPLWAARVAVYPCGDLPYSEADLRPAGERDKLLMSIGANGWFHQARVNSGATTQDFDQWSVGCDAAVAWKGLFATVELDYLFDAQPAVVPDIHAAGVLVQAGYMIVPERFGIGLRYTEVTWTGTVSSGIFGPTNTATRESLLVLGYYFHRHDMKLQLDSGRVTNHFASSGGAPNHDNSDEWRTRLQFQITF